MYSEKILSTKWNLNRISMKSEYYMDLISDKRTNTYPRKNP